MRIDPEHPIIPATSSREQRGSAPVLGEQTFASQLQAQQRAQMPAVQTLIALGDELSRALTLRRLIAYKQQLRSFLETIARQTVGLKRHVRADRYGRVYHDSLLSSLQTEWQQLTEEAIETEQGRLHLLATIGHIRGLLVDLRT